MLWISISSWIRPPIVTMLLWWKCSRINFSYLCYKRLELISLTSSMRPIHIFLIISMSGGIENDWLWTRFITCFSNISLLDPCYHLWPRMSLLLGKLPRNMLLYVSNILTWASLIRELYMTLFLMLLALWMILNNVN